MAERIGERMFVFQLAALRAAPDEGAEQVTQVLPGEPLTVEVQENGWALVRTAYDYPGWLLETAFGGDADPAWLEPQVDEPLTFARALVGAPYLWGGMTDAGIDCSGLVHMSFRATGRLVPRDADQQEEAGTPVAEPGPGDLVSYGEKSADHIAFWLGDGRILHATQRDGISRVLEEPEPPELHARRRATFTL